MANISFHNSGKHSWSLDSIPLSPIARLPASGILAFRGAHSSGVMVPSNFPDFFLFFFVSLS